ncbi:Mitochondrial DNA replication protein yhm2 [Terramyces sp. JEL0728]|nr:Mitochondrial DNA replication protein yhm2 [Terramyces sp. JEL0728]
MADQKEIKKKPVSFGNLLIGAGLNLFETSTLGQPLEVTKTQMAANRSLGMVGSMKTIYSRGGILGFYQGLIPWAWIEAGTKGSVLIFAQSEVEFVTKKLGFSNFSSAIISGMAGGVAQAYTTMGFCTFMKTVEVTRSKAGGGVQKSTWQVASEIFKKEGIVGINKGVNAVALRQCTNWGSRFGLSVLAEGVIRDYYFGKQDKDKHTKPLPPLQKILASAIGGGLSCWNQPIEVIRVEMQSQLKVAGRPEKMTIVKAAQWIYKNNGLMGFYRGVTPRIGLGIWQTICMVYGGELVKGYFKTH